MQPMLMSAPIAAPASIIELNREMTAPEAWVFMKMSKACFYTWASEMKVKAMQGRYSVEQLLAARRRQAKKNGGYE